VTTLAASAGAAFWTPPSLGDITFADIFCGAGGSSVGLTMAGFNLKVAANHWATAINTHSANFDAEHLCADINHYDMRRLPTTDILWASPICTEGSPASGRNTGYRRSAQSKAGQVDLLQSHGHVSQAGMERTRATFHDVIRATEVHRYKTVLVENVPDVVDRWELFDWWVDGMCLLGYQVQFVSANSAHVGGDGIPYAPQWRDRLYMVFNRKDIRRPDVDLHPISYCARCDADVYGVQTWAPAVQKRHLKVGRYRRDPNSNYGQYWYCCERPGCGRRVEPYVLPAAAAIDWSDLGELIGDRNEPLKPNTVRRIQAGLDEFAQPVVATVAGNTFERAGYRRVWPAFDNPLNTRSCTGTDALAVPPFMGNSNHDDDRLYRAGDQPLPARTTKIGDWVVNPPMVLPVGGPNHDTPARSAFEPLTTRLANVGGTDSVVTPEAFMTVLRNHATVTRVSDPMATIAASGNHHYLTVPPGAEFTSLVLPYYSKAKARTSGEPFDTVTTRDTFALVNGRTVDINKCRYRMVKPWESLISQTFPGGPAGYPGQYRMTGNQGEQTMQAGNAVSCNVAHWLGTRVARVLGVSS
jgi:DNA (cytosine-5)-methyltransferase 1